jgi:hypothetical protein
MGKKDKFGNIAGALGDVFGGGKKAEKLKKGAEGGKEKAKEGAKKKRDGAADTFLKYVRAGQEAMELKSHYESQAMKTFLPLLDMAKVQGALKDGSLTEKEIDGAKDYMIKEVKAKLKGGFSFEGSAHGGLTWKWSKDGKQFEELFPIFDYKPLVPLLRPMAKKKLHVVAAGLVEQSEEAVATDLLNPAYRQEYVAVLRHLRIEKMVSLGMGLEQFLKSDYGRDLEGFLAANADLKKQGVDPYLAHHTSYGVYFQPSYQLKKRGAAAEYFYLKLGNRARYDKKLMLKKLKKR